MILSGGIEHNQWLDDPQPRLIPFKLPSSQSAPIPIPGFMNEPLRREGISPFYQQKNPHRTINPLEVEPEPRMNPVSVVPDSGLGGVPWLLLALLAASGLGIYALSRKKGKGKGKKSNAVNPA